ncbi:MAG: pH regulation protein F [Rhodobacteraceae bacterium]|nr:MAG: pH regulation protein F [Paracoccaceae bacterium]
MTTFFGIIVVTLLVSILTGLIRVHRGPRPADRMMAAQLVGSAAVAILLILSRAMDMPALLDVAVVFALLAAVAVVGFVVLASRKVS